MKIFLMFILSILISGHANAEKNKQRITEHLNEFKTVAINCHQSFMGEMAIYNMKRDFEGVTAVSNLHSNIYAAARQCKDEGKAKIKSDAGAFIKVMKKSKAESIAKDYIIQAMATIDATTKNDLFDVENSKLNALYERIELEISLK